MKNRFNEDFLQLGCIFHMAKLKIKRKIGQQYFQIRGAYYMRKHGYFDILRANVGVCIIRGCGTVLKNKTTNGLIQFYFPFVYLFTFLGPKLYRHMKKKYMRIFRFFISTKMIIHVLSDSINKQWIILHFK